MKTTTVRTGTLTTEHAASSYNQPVLVIAGTAYGPADMIYSKTFGDYQSAAATVETEAVHREHDLSLTNVDWDMMAVFTGHEQPRGYKASIDLTDITEL